VLFILNVYNSKNIIALTFFGQDFCLKILKNLSLIIITVIFMEHAKNLQIV